MSLSPEEASRILSAAVDFMEALEDAERPLAYAVPRSLLNCGEAMVFASALIHLLAEAHPHLVDESVTDVAATYFRSRH